MICSNFAIFTNKSQKMPLNLIMVTSILMASSKVQKYWQKIGIGDAALSFLDIIIVIFPVCRQ